LTAIVHSDGQDARPTIIHRNDSVHLIEALRLAAIFVFGNVSIENGVTANVHPERQKE